jgi:hypothetical protein
LYEGRYCRLPHGSEREEKVESIPVLLKKVQEVVNQYVRLRDRKEKCISCGGKVEDAGHYLPVGSYSGVRFDLDNIHGQCHHECNTGKYGNPEAYREGLLKRIGKRKVEALEKRARESKQYKWTRPELLDLMEAFKVRIKQLKK